MCVFPCLTLAWAFRRMCKSVFSTPILHTKKKGEGTGLGLAVVHGIVEGCQGAITVDSQPGKGSCFRIYLPETREEEKTEDAPLATVAGNETILLVDDEVDLLDSYTALFTHYGYAVSSFKSSAKALEQFRKNPDSFNLVVTDQTMPELTGLELASEIQKIRPGKPINFMHRIQQRCRRWKKHPKGGYSQSDYEALSL